MKKLLIVANWKSNKTQKEVEEYFLNFPNTIQENTIAVICPPFLYLSICKQLITEKQLSISIGGQDVSAFSSGAHTGEVNTGQLKEFADFVIIGHSERRKNGESEEILKQKVEEANKNDLKVIYCISDLSQEVPNGVYAVAYEPLFAIGSGNPDTPENAQKVAKKIKEKINVEHILYGGSVTSKNVGSFIAVDDINGVLVGGASLDPLEFSKILNS